MDHADNLVDVLEFDTKIQEEEENSSFKIFCHGDVESELLLMPIESDVDYEKVRKEILKTVSPFDSKSLQ